MSDSGGGGNQFTSEMKSAVSEVAKDVKDAVGEMIEQGVQSVAGPTLTPQQIQQKQLEDQKKLAETRRKIKFIEKVDQEQKMVRQQEKQRQMQRQEMEAEQQQEKKVDQRQKQQVVKRPGLDIREDIARSRQEIGKGRGIGG